MAGEKVKTIKFKPLVENPQSIGELRANLKSMNDELKLTKIGSERFVELTSSIATTSQELDRVTPKTNAYGKEVSKLSEYIREQRTEDRERSFVMKQMNDVIGASAVGLSIFGGIAGESEGQVKKFSDSLNKGFIAFQGLDFALSSVEGPWGIAIAVIGGLTAAIASMASEDANATKKHKELTDAIYANEVAAGQIGKSDQYAKLQKDVDEARKKLDELTKVTVAAVNVYGRGGEVIDRVLTRSIKGSTEEIQNQTEALTKVQAALKQFEDTLKDTGAVPLPEWDLKPMINSERQLAEEEANLIEKRKQYNVESGTYIDLTKQIEVIERQKRLNEMADKEIVDTLNGVQHKYNMSLQTGIDNLDRFKHSLSALSTDPNLQNLLNPKPFQLPSYKPGMVEKGGQSSQADAELDSIRKRMAAMNEATDAWYLKLSEDSKTFVSGFKDGFDAVLGEIKTGAGSLFESVFGEANSLLEKFAESIFSSIISRYAQLSMASVGESLFGFLGFGGGSGEASNFLGGPTVPAFDNGGIIPGSPSEIRLVLAHGGERMIPAHQSGSAVRGSSVTNFHFHFNTPVPHSDWVVGSVVSAMKQRGITDPNRVFVNRQNRLTFEQ